MIGGSLAQVRPAGAEGVAASPHGWDVQYTPAEYKTHNLYAGVMGGWNWQEDIKDDGRWDASIVAGYLWRNSTFGAGIEADYTRDLEDFEGDDGAASIRGRAGVFLDNKTFLYATAGVTQALSDQVEDLGLDKGLVVGGGLEVQATERVFVRGEVLHTRHSDDYIEWGDEGSTTLRVGLGLRF